MGISLYKSMRTCKIERCNKKHWGKGFCKKHWSKQWRKEHKKERAEYNKQYRKEHKKHYLKLERQRRIRYKEHRAEYNKQYYQTPAGKASKKAHRHNRRALTKELTKAIIQRVYEANIIKYGQLTCVLCFKPIEFGDDSLEHLTPLSRGGSNDFNNLGVSHLSCNQRKFIKTLEEWLNI